MTEYYCCGGFAPVCEEAAEDVPAETGTAEAGFGAGPAVDDAVLAFELECDTGCGASTPAVLEPRPSF
jgi:hypothetical protein